jgi:hypothetical protein
MGQCWQAGLCVDLEHSSFLEDTSILLLLLLLLVLLLLLKVPLIDTLIYVYREDGVKVCLLQGAAPCKRCGGLRATCVAVAVVRSTCKSAAVKAAHTVAAQC